MGVTSSSKQISTNLIDCGGMLKVTLALSASPDIVTNPTDIVLVLDRSGSMAGSPLENMKAALKRLLISSKRQPMTFPEATSAPEGRIGIVSFAGAATADTQLITSVSALKSAIDGLIAGGSTNHADAFAKGMQLFDPSSPNAKVIVLFTDGKPHPALRRPRGSGSKGVRHYHLLHWLNLARTGWTLTP